jgi:hypothetical protein
MQSITLLKGTVVAYKTVLTAVAKTGELQGPDKLQLKAHCLRLLQSTLSTKFEQHQMY